MIRPGVGEQAAVRRDPRPGRRHVRRDPALASADRASRREHLAAVQGASAGPGDRRGRHRVPRPRSRSSRSGRPTSGAPSCWATIRPKSALRDALPRVWQAGRDYFAAHATVSGAELFDYVVGVARTGGFEWGSHDRRPSGGRVSRTRRSRATAPSGTSCPARTNPCGVRTVAGGRAIGSSRSIWSTARAVLAASMSSYSICPSADRKPGACAGRGGSAPFALADGERHPGEFLGNRPQPALPVDVMGLLAGRHHLGVALCFGESVWAEVLPAQHARIGRGP